ncbi:aminotransferase class I/II-fold pyridoxal phosphate-dependent enzyme [Spirillospora albida]|uniref:aminotransferase class I/II-fold pyridoxal phosphate-dependent enzyme n=1 Tax=Spirillospora albida TaxID=58123 RepID=UPI000692533D|nr:aminotransferase class I/II-fold pyridoxal phosphate-dependent enzyme [Spirillospora albida]
MTSAHQRLGEPIADLRDGRGGPRTGPARGPDRAGPGSRPVVLTMSDYLALGEHQEITAAAIGGLRGARGVPSPRAARLGTRRLADALAAHLGAASVGLCASGWAANTAVMRAVVDPGAPVYLDVLAHVSLWEGARAAGGATACFRHNDLDDLRQRIAAGGPGVIAVDALYGDDGSVCPLPGLADVAEETGCTLVVDETHCLGTHGDRGEGLVAALALEDRVHLRTAGLAKAFPIRAGLIAAGRPGFTDRLRYAARPAGYGSPLPPNDLAGLAAALPIVRDEGWRRERLRAVSVRVRRGLLALGYGVGAGDSQIISLATGSEADARLLRDDLAARGVLTAALFPTAPRPAAPGGRLRLSMHAGLTDGDVEHVLDGFAGLCDRLHMPA